MLPRRETLTWRRWQQTRALKRAQLTREQAHAAAQNMLEEYCDHNFEWAWGAVAGNRLAREARLETLQAKKVAKTISLGIYGE